jgi:hypothetical protein
VVYRKRGYLYRSRRSGGKVQTEYLGKGEGAEIVALMAAEASAERQAQRKAWRAERARIEAADSALAGLGRLVSEATRAALIAAGYHPHKRQWRKKRNGKRNLHSRV